MRHAPLAERLLFIAGRYPIFPRAVDILRRGPHPLKAILRHLFQRLANIIGNIGRHAEDRTGFKHTGQRFQMLGRHETAAVMARLGPRIGIKQKGPRDRGGRQHIEHVAHIAGIDAQIIHACAADLAQEHRHAIDIGLAADDADTGVQAGLMDHMLAPAKADLKPSLAPTEHRRQVEGVAVRVRFPIHRAGAEGGQIFFQIDLLAVAQMLATAAAIEIARRAIRVMGFGQDRSSGSHSAGV